MEIAAYIISLMMIHGLFVTGRSTGLACCAGKACIPPSVFLVGKFPKPLLPVLHNQLNYAAIKSLTAFTIC
jgi:hypothetical protein